MNSKELKLLVKQIVEKANALKNKHTDQKKAPVNYACIFSQSDGEYENLINITKELGKVIKETPTGPLFHIKSLNTISGNLVLPKIRKAASTRPERGDADFTIENYSQFKKKYITQPGFKLIKREKMEMLELVDSRFNIRVYFSNPPLTEQFKL